MTGDITAPAAVAVPSHVPPERVVDFDMFNPAGAEADLHRAWARLHDGPDIVWTPRNGGHWIATRADDIEVMQQGQEHFSHERFSLPRSETDAQVIPLGFDQPRHTPFRKLIMRGFNPRAMRAMGDVARETAIELIEGMLPRGHCEFIGEFAQILPINVFLTMVDLPAEDRQKLLLIADGTVRAADPIEKAEAYARTAEYIATYVTERAAAPGDDLISSVANAEIDGRPITFEESVGVSLLLLLGGLDTVASQLGFIAKFLADSPAHRHQLIEDQRLVSFATEELLRRFSIVNTARLVKDDHEYKGVSFKAGDMIQLPKSLAGLDDRRYEDPFAVDFRRKPSSLKQAAFGAGIHTCPGNNLARREIMIYLEEWLSRIPNFTVDDDKPLRFASGMVNTVTELYLRW